MNFASENDNKDKEMALFEKENVAKFVIKMKITKGPSNSNPALLSLSDDVLPFLH